MSTNSRTFRTKLSEFFDMALKKPVAIARGTDRFILMNEEEYLKLKDEVLSLQRNLLAALEVQEGKFIRSETPESFEKLFNDTSTKVRKKYKEKQAVGE
jgi:PHD/YefM family antitoxin component YafN of YafNO toxin-antitoxin module